MYKDVEGFVCACSAGNKRLRARVCVRVRRAIESLGCGVMERQKRIIWCMPQFIKSARKHGNICEITNCHSFSACVPFHISTSFSEGGGKIKWVINLSWQLRHMNEAPRVSIRSKPAANLARPPYVAITEQPEYICSVHYASVLYSWQMFFRILQQISSSPRTSFIGWSSTGGCRKTTRALRSLPRLPQG